MNILRTGTFFMSYEYGGIFFFTYLMACLRIHILYVGIQDQYLLKYYFRLLKNPLKLSRNSSDL